MMGYALAHWAGIRRDGVGSPRHGQNWIGSLRYAVVPGMADTWKKAPVVFEWFGDFDYLKSKGWSFDAVVNFMLNNHVSVINDNFGRVPPEAMPQLEKLARLASYCVVLRGNGARQNRAARRGLGRTWPLLSAAPSGRVSTPISVPPRPAKSASRVGCFAGATQQLAAILAGLPESQTLKKFLASKIRPGHCGCAAILELVEAA